MYRIILGNYHDRCIGEPNSFEELEEKEVLCTESPATLFQALAIFYKDHPEFELDNPEELVNYLGGGHVYKEKGDEIWFSSLKVKFE